MKAGGEAGDRMRWLDGHHRLSGHEFEQNPGVSERRKSGVLQSTGLQRVRHDLVTKQVQNKPLSRVSSPTHIKINLYKTLYFQIAAELFSDFTLSKCWALWVDNVLVSLLFLVWVRDDDL